MSAIGRAPIEKMSRMMPPTPVAAPWYGSTADGWLWLSMRIGDREAVADVDDARALARARRAPTAPRSGTARGGSFDDL